MFNSFILRCTLFFVRLVYFSLPVIKLVLKIGFWLLIGFVTLLLLFLVF